MSGDRPGVGTPPPGLRRSVARLSAVQALYQIDLGGGAADAVIAEFVRHRLGREVDGQHYGEADAALFSDIVKGVSLRRADVDRAIAAALTPDWPLERLEVTLRAILRAGAYELLARPDVPVRVVISEYLDVAHAFFAAKEPGLVNGVLDRVAHLVRPENRAESQDGGGRTR